MIDFDLKKQLCVLKKQKIKYINEHFNNSFEKIGIKLNILTTCSLSL